MVGGALAAGMLVGAAGPAAAWTADATVSQTCVNGTSTSTVLFSAFVAVVGRSAPAGRLIAPDPRRHGLARRL